MKCFFQIFFLCFVSNLAFAADNPIIIRIYKNGVPSHKEVVASILMEGNLTVCFAAVGEKKIKEPYTEKFAFVTPVGTFDGPRIFEAAEGFPMHTKTVVVGGVIIKPDPKLAPNLTDPSLMFANKSISSNLVPGANFEFRGAKSKEEIAKLGTQMTDGGVLIPETDFVRIFKAAKVGASVKLIISNDSKEISPEETTAFNKLGL
jgi:hypothetical protein